MFYVMATGERPDWSTPGAWLQTLNTRGVDGPTVALLKQSMHWNKDERPTAAALLELIKSLNG